MIKTVVLTSSILYAEPTNINQQKGKMNVPDRKMVARFAQCLYSFLDKQSQDNKENICYIVAGSEDALPTIKKVIESHNVKESGLQDYNSSLPATIDLKRGVTLLDNADKDAPVSQGKMCEFCGDSKLCQPVVCCRRLLCLDCEQSAPNCPFCSTFWKVITGDQPPGFMTVSQISDHADGYERTSTWKIDYYFPPGIQKKCHPHPGKSYDPVQRTAFIPSNIQGLQVLMLLRLSFIRNLTFTIGHSMTRGKDDVIIWNDISHKTKLHGELFGYPDPNYLDQVTVELAIKGVKFDNLTESEKEALAKFRRDITILKQFSDL